MMGLEHLHDKVNAGNQAKALRSNPIFAEVFTAEKGRLFNEFSRSKWWQRLYRRSLWEQCQAVNALEHALNVKEYEAALAKEEIVKRSTAKVKFARA